jgi:hypothetical protein
MTKIPSVSPLQALRQKEGANSGLPVQCLAVAGWRPRPAIAVHSEAVGQSGGGRAHVQSALSMNPLVAVRDNPVLKPFDERLRARGKAAKVVLTACRRELLTILNARVKHHTPWHVQEVPNA